MRRVATRDLYEGVYYGMNQCVLETIEGKMENGRLLCEMIFTGDNLAELQTRFFQGTAEVNLIEFRRYYAHLNSFLVKEKRKLKNAMDNNSHGPAGKEARS